MGPIFLTFNYQTLLHFGQINSFILFILAHKLSTRPILPFAAKYVQIDRGNQTPALALECK